MITLKRTRGHTLYVAGDIGLVATRDSAQEIRPGDIVYFEAYDEHWHGATSARFMSHVAIQEVCDQGDGVTWLAHVADGDYQEAAARAK